MASSDSADAPFVFREPAAARRLREVLDNAGFTQRGVLERLDGESVQSAVARELPLLLRRTDRGTAQDSLIRLFLIGTTVDLDVASRAVAPMKLDDWIGLGLLKKQEKTVSAAVRLMPFAGLLLAHDRPGERATGFAPDYVMGLGTSSLTLANLTVRRPSASTLDLGTGCGFQALLAAAHSQHVVAVDRNPRAVRLATFNAMLNQLENVECREGDLFEPVRGLRFDLVVTNPPFVISPETRCIYRDSGLLGDEIVRSIVRRAPEFLTEGGYCQILCNWAHVAGQDWRERLAGWVAGSGCDAWVMRSQTIDAATYAAKWIRHTECDAPEAFCRRFEQWVAYYERQRIEAMSDGIITLRLRPGGANWFRADDGPAEMLGPAGEAVARGFGLYDFLQTATEDEVLLRQRLRLSPDVRLEQRFEPADGGWVATESELQLRKGLGYSGRVDPYTACALAQCDGNRTVGELAADLATATRDDPAKVRSALLGILRRLIERGFLLPQPSEPPHPPSSLPV